MARTKTPPKAQRKTTSADAPKNAIQLLKQDHAIVDKLFKAFHVAKDSGEAAEKAGIVVEICTALSIHATIEEEIFYPEARDALGDDGQDLLDEAEVEHQGAKDLIAQLSEMSPDEDLYDAKVTVLGEYIKHHVKEEEDELFPEVEATDLDLNALGRRLKERKETLQAEMQEEAVS